MRCNELKSTAIQKLPSCILALTSFSQLSAEGMTLVSSVQLTKSVELVVGLVKNDWIHGVVATHSPAS